MYKQTYWILLMDRWLDEQTEEWNHWWMNGRVDWLSAHAKFNKFMDLGLSWSGLLLKAGCLSNVHHFQQSSKFALQKKKPQKNKNPAFTYMCYHQLTFCTEVIWVFCAENSKDFFCKLFACSAIMSSSERSPLTCNESWKWIHLANVHNYISQLVT